MPAETRAYARSNMGVCPREAEKDARADADRDARSDAALTDHTEQTTEQTHARRASRDAARQGSLMQERAKNEFETFWQAYPSRHPHTNPRNEAGKAFAAAIKAGADPAAIIRGARGYAAHAAEHISEPRYIKQAASWLRQKLWEDYQNVFDPRPVRLRAGMN
jgi:hypothetical protein